MPISPFTNTIQPIYFTALEVVEIAALANNTTAVIIPGLASNHIIVYKIYVRSSVAGKVYIERTGFPFAAIHVLANQSFLIDFGAQGLDLINALGVNLRNLTGGAADFTVTVIFDYAENPA